MRNPETYDDFVQWMIEDETAGTDESGQWAKANPEKYTDLRIAAFKQLPRDMYKKWEREGDWEAISAGSHLVLYWSDHVNERRYRGDEQSARYWDEYCKYFKITRATLFAARRKICEQEFKTVLNDPDSTKEDIQKAWQQVEWADKEYHNAKDYKKLKQRHKDAELAKAIFDVLLQQELERTPEGAGLSMNEIRQQIITEVMHIMWKANNSKSPSRPTVVRWLERHRILEYEYWRPEAIEKAKQLFPDTPLRHLTMKPK